MTRAPGPTRGHGLQNVSVTWVTLWAERIFERFKHSRLQIAGLELWSVRLFFGRGLLGPDFGVVVTWDGRSAFLLAVDSKSDRIDARKLAELLRGNQLTSGYHGEHGMRLKGIRSQPRNHYEGSHTEHESNQSALPKLAIPCSGTSVCAPRDRATTS